MEKPTEGEIVDAAVRRLVELYGLQHVYGPKPLTFWQRIKKMIMGEPL